MKTHINPTLLAALLGTVFAAEPSAIASDSDFGDAGNIFAYGQSSYPVTLADDGARHVIEPGFCLGTLVDTEPDGFASTSLGFDGDDNDNLDDEDGVTFGYPLKIGGKGTMTVVVTDDSDTGGYLDAWIDYDANGNWETDEHVFGGVSQPVAAGTNILQFDVPADTTAYSAYTRVRLSRAGRLLPTGEAPDGEVEDYSGPAFAPPDTTITGRVFADLNTNGMFDSNDVPVPVVMYLDRNNDGIRQTVVDPVAVADPETGLYEIRRSGPLSGTLRVLADNFGHPMIVPVTDYSASSAIPPQIPKDGPRPADAGDDCQVGKGAYVEGKAVVAKMGDSRTCHIESLVDALGYHYLRISTSGLAWVGGSALPFFADVPVLCEPIAGLRGPFHPSNARVIYTNNQPVLVIIGNVVDETMGRTIPAELRLNPDTGEVLSAIERRQPAMAPAGQTVLDGVDITEYQALMVEQGYPTSLPSNPKFLLIRSGDNTVVGQAEGVAVGVTTESNGTITVVVSLNGSGYEANFPSDIASNAGAPVEGTSIALSNSINSEEPISGLIAAEGPLVLYSPGSSGTLLGNRQTGESSQLLKSHEGVVLTDITSSGNSAGRIEIYFPVMRTLGARFLNWVRIASSSSNGIPVSLPSGGNTNNNIFIHTEEPAELGMDLADAPDGVAEPNYPTTLAHNGARHVIVKPPEVFLGQRVDPDNDAPQRSATDVFADQDDLLGFDDDDGVEFPGPLVPGSNADVVIIASTETHLDAWIDFNRDGDWDDAGEQIFTNQFVQLATNYLTFAVPTDAVTQPRPTYGRFRVSSQGGLNYDGLADDGEVEDYPIWIGSGKTIVTYPAADGSRTLHILRPFRGILQHATNVNGPWENLPDASNPLPMDTSADKEGYYRCLPFKPQ